LTDRSIELGRECIRTAGDEPVASGLGVGFSRSGAAPSAVDDGGTSTRTCRGCVPPPSSSESDELLLKKKLLDPGRSAGWMNIVGGMLVWQWQ